MRIGIDASRAFTKQPTGTERYAFEVITRMMRLEEARKHEFILYLRNNAPSDPPLNLRGGRNYRFVKIPLKYLWTQIGLAYRSWVDRLDVLWVPAHTLPVFRKPGLQSIVTIHGIEYEWLPAYENRLQRWYLPLSTKYAVAKADKIIAVSEFTKEQLIERLRAKAKKIEVVYEGFNPEILNSNIEDPNKFKILNKYQLKPKKYLLFVGTVQPRKNLVRLVEGFSRLTWEKNTPFDSPSLIKEGDRGSFELKLVISGKLGWNYNEVLEAPERFGVADRVIFTKYVDDTEREILLKNALVYVQPSITEGFGLPVLEAMAAGIPVVSSEGGALKEVVGRAGILFDPEDVNGIRKAMQLMVTSHTTRLKYINLGYKRIRDFSWDKAAEKTLKLLSSNL